MWSSSFRLQGDEVRAFRAGSLLCVAWQVATKKKPLIVLSSDCAHNMTTVRSQRATQQKPVVVDQYNYSMNGVDRADQYTVLLIPEEKCEMVEESLLLDDGGGGSQ